MLHLTSKIASLILSISNITYLIYLYHFLKNKRKITKKGIKTRLRFEIWLSIINIINAIIGIMMENYIGSIILAILALIWLLNSIPCYSTLKLVNEIEEMMDKVNEAIKEKESQEEGKNDTNAPDKME